MLNLYSVVQVESLLAVDSTVTYFVIDYVTWGHVIITISTGL